MIDIRPSSDVSHSRVCQTAHVDTFRRTYLHPDVVEAAPPLIQPCVSAPIDVDELVAHAPAPTSSDWLLLLAHRSHGHNSWAHSSTRRLTPRSSALDSVSCAARLFHHSTASASPPTPPLRCDHCLRPDPQSLSHNATDTHSRRPAPWSNPSVRPALQSRSRRRSTYGTRSP